MTSDASPASFLPKIYVNRLGYRRMNMRKVLANKVVRAELIKQCVIVARFFA